MAGSPSGFTPELRAFLIRITEMSIKERAALAAELASLLASLHPALLTRPEELNPEDT